MEIGPWKAIDATWLKAAIGEFLRANLERGGDLLPTSRNCEVLLRLGLAGAEAGDPCLVAVVGGEPVGYVLWVGAPPTLDTRYKTINALGSYTAPGSRSNGVAAALRAEAWAMTRALGFERVIGPVHLSNARGIQEFVEVFHAWPTTVQMEALVPPVGA